MKTLFLVLFALSFLAATYAYPSADLVKSLPGWTGDLPTRHFSGYLSVPSVNNSTSFLHYYLVEADEQAESAPTILWLNGGPGCSSLDGWVYEHGPFEISLDGQLSPRPYRWNRLANMLYIEAPVGVGFSYNSDNLYNLDDDRTAYENFLAVEKFYELFPELSKNKFYIMGESYAGIYVPTLAEEITKATLASTYTGAPLTGIAVGNGCSGTEVGICGTGRKAKSYMWEYMNQTPFISAQLKDAINKSCDFVQHELSPVCMKLLREASKALHNINLYNIYGDCVNDMCSTSTGTYSYFSEAYLAKNPEKFSKDEIQNYLNLPLNGKVPPRLEEKELPYGPTACLDSRAASNYLNRAEVQDALHVRDPGFCWSICNTAKNWKYTSTRTNLPRDTYPFLINNIDVLVYNGDWDACVPYNDADEWTASLGLPTKTPWHSWRFESEYDNDNQVGGFAIDYDTSAISDKSFQFITIKGGRHEVPMTAPAQALEMVKRVIEGQKF